MTIRRLAAFTVIAVSGVTLVGRTDLQSATQAAPKRIVLIAGRASHGPGEHEFRAGSMLLQKALSGVSAVKVDVFTNGWPTKMVDGQAVDDNAPIEQADAIFIYADGGSGHLLRGDPVINPRRESVAGFGHYGVGCLGRSGGITALIGGYYETTGR